VGTRLLARMQTRVHPCSRHPRASHTHVTSSRPHTHCRRGARPRPRPRQQLHPHHPHHQHQPQHQPPRHHRQLRCGTTCATRAVRRSCGRPLTCARTASTLTRRTEVRSRRGCVFGGLERKRRGRWGRGEVSPRCLPPSQQAAEAWPLPAPTAPTSSLAHTGAPAHEG
jgi:hypothetical protein